MSKDGQCSRCGAEAKVIPVFVVHGTWFVPSQSDFNTAVAPTAEFACGKCITDNELFRESAVRDTVLFVTRHLLKGAQDHPELAKGLETVRAYHMVRSNNSDDTGRSGVLRLLGLEV